MASVLRMPGVSADATDAEIMEWTVPAGARVARGDVIANIETDKAVVELEADSEGVLLKTLAGAGDRVPIGDPIAIILGPGEDAGDEESLLAGLGLAPAGGATPAGAGNGRADDADAPEPTPETERLRKQGLGPQAAGPLPGVDEERSQDALVPGAGPEIERTADEVVDGNGVNGGGRIFASPLARRLALGAGLDLAGLTGSGPGGRITRRDIEWALSRPTPAASTAPAGPASPLPATEPTPAAAAPPPAAATAPPASTAPRTTAHSTGDYTDIPHSKFRRAVASALTASKQQVPHFYLRATCRVDELLALRERVNAAGGVRITINDFLVKAAAQAMVDVPDMNVSWTPDAVRRFASVDIAVALNSDRGLLTPVVRSVQTRALSDISASIKGLAARANAGSLKQHELEGGSLTVSNLGMYGVEDFAAIINPPQVGILAVGAVTARPVELSDGQLGLGKGVAVTLSVDHRAVDGAMAAQWLMHFRQLVESPLRLLI